MLPILRKNGGWTVPAERFDSFVNRVFEDMDRALGSAGGALTQGSIPVSLWEDEQAYHVEAEVPGVAESDIEVTVHDGQLWLRFERKPEEGRQYLYNGRSFGRFDRVFALPDAVNPDEVQAHLQDGILRLTLPKSPAARPKKIAIGRVQAG